ncbi:MAG: hypothetical protein WBL70_12945 [Candidatus Acidiferrales bacterium]
MTVPGESRFVPAAFREASIRERIKPVSLELTDEVTVYDRGEETRVGA